MKEKGTLYIVPTPIGNLEDITLRAMRVLGQVDIIACEDTRTTGKLLELLKLPKKSLISYHQHNELGRTSEILNKLLSGSNIALVSDAGTPLVSDPGFKLVSQAHENGVEVVSLPGASALVSALVGSGMMTDSFIFMGFPPQKKGRQTFIKKVMEIEMTAVIYESSHRIEKFFKQAIELGYGIVNCCIAKEISKIHEKYIFGTCQQLHEKLEQEKDLVKGEFVIIISKDK